jgi:enamine deaminase RidA (YjgF/YER057c/UK114 family)
MKTLFTIFSLAFWLSMFSQTPEQNIEKAGMKLPAITTPCDNYVNVVRVGNVLYLSGKGPLLENPDYVKGKLGRDLSVEDGYQAAKLAALNQLTVLKEELGDLSKIKRIVKVSGYVNASDDFYDAPKVINGFSDVMITVFGEKGKHARTALGVSALPNNWAVEVEMIVETR